MGPLCSSGSNVHRCGAGNVTLIHRGQTRSPAPIGRNASWVPRETLRYRVCSSQLGELLLKSVRYQQPSRVMPIVMTSPGGAVNGAQHAAAVMSEMGYSEGGLHSRATVFFSVIFLLVNILSRKVERQCVNNP